MVKLLIDSSIDTRLALSPALKVIKKYIDNSSNFMRLRAPKSYRNLALPHLVYEARSVSIIMHETFQLDINDLRVLYLDIEIC